MRNIVISVVEPEEMRYRTVGDWQIDKQFGDTNATLKITVADMGDWRYNMLVAVHELIEVIQCRYKGISEKQVDKFDFAHEDDEDPGSHPKAPYHFQHMSAMSIEMILSVLLGVRWRPYEDAMERAWKKAPKRKKK